MLNAPAVAEGFRLRQSYGETRWPGREGSRLRPALLDYDEARKAE